MPHQPKLRACQRPEFLNVKLKPQAIFLAHKTKKALQPPCSDMVLDKSTNLVITSASPSVPEAARSDPAAYSSREAEPESETESESEAESEPESESDEGDEELSAPEQSDADALHFSSFDEAKSCLGGAKWTSSAVGVPQTEKQEKECIRRLLKAFKDTSRALDKKTSAYRRRFERGYYDDHAIEFCAWNILEHMKDLHTHGNRPFIFDKNIMRSMSSTRGFTFKRRLDDICEVLELSKYCAVQVLKGEKILTIVYNPDKLYNGIITNSKSNAKRNSWIINGRDADKTYVPGPKRRKTTNNAAAHTSLTANAPSAFTPVNPPARVDPLQLQLKKRGRSDGLASGSFTQTFKPVAARSSIPPKQAAPATNPRSTQLTPSSGMAAPDGDTTPRSKAASTAADSHAAGDIDGDVEADTESTRATATDDSDDSDVDMDSDDGDMQSNSYTPAETEEAMSLMRRSSFANALNRVYKSLDRGF